MILGLFSGVCRASNSANATAVWNALRTYLPSIPAKVSPLSAEVSRELLGVEFNDGLLIVYTLLIQFLQPLEVIFENLHGLSARQRWTV